MNLSALSEPFPAEDIEWRVSRAGMGKNGIFCFVLAYITARAHHSRLDVVCGPENWRNEEPRIVEYQPGRFAFVAGISIRINNEWITKWDVAEPTNIEPAKGGFSGAMKRAGAAWGIGRYLYHLDETFAETSDTGGRGWNWAKLSEKQGGASYYWKTPTLPGWALPKDSNITTDELTSLKRSWRDKFAAGETNPETLREGFSRFVSSVVGEFPLSDSTCWTRDALNRVTKKIAQTTDTEGVDSDVPFE